MRIEVMTAATNVCVRLVLVDMVLETNWPECMCLMHAPLLTAIFSFLSTVM
jgi:hypothetical protein